jgi:tetratricopeptide (TPR) repeat protein
MTKKTRYVYIAAVVIIAVSAGTGIIYNKYFRTNDRDRIISKLSEKYYYLNLYKDVAYTGDDKCKPCHNDIHETFHQTGMGKSLYRPSAGNETEDFLKDSSVYNEKTDFYYKAYKKGNEYFQKEYRLDKDGRVIHELEKKVDYVIGSGNNTKSYLYGENGFYYEMPLSWYTEKAKWDMSPGYQMTNLRFSRPVVQECMNCHNSYSGFVEFSENKFDVKLKEGIGCESCHGPGELHIRRQTEDTDLFSDLDKDTIDRTIVNPVNLPLEEKLSVCFQCHLQGDVRVFAENKKQSDFRPGMKLEEVKSVFIQDNVEKGNFKIASHAARMYLSDCFVKSNGQMTCITCHDPHVPSKSVSKDFFNSKCTGCHNVQSLSVFNSKADHRENSNCISCHMRQGSTKDVQHVNFTDHWIRKEISILSEEEKDKLEENNNPVTLKNFNNADNKFAAIELGIAYVAYFDSKHSHPDYLKKAIPLLEENLKSFPAHKNGLYYLGLAYLRNGRIQEAISTFQKFLTLDPGNAQAYYLLGNAFEKSKNNLKAIESYQNSLEYFPDNLKALNNLGNVYYTTGKIREAMDVYYKAMSISSGATNILNNLADINLYQMKNIDEAKNLLNKAIDIDPDYVPALNNLGNAYMLSGETTEAEKIFNEIILKDPKNVLAYGNLAVLYEDRGDVSKAKSILSKVLLINPNDARAKQMMEKLNNK